MEEKVMKDCKVLALCSQKGGVGKTTSCVGKIRKDAFPVCR